LLAVTVVAAAFVEGAWRRPIAAGVRRFDQVVSYELAGD
jgi:hypothetical protein